MISSMLEDLGKVYLILHGVWAVNSFVLYSYSVLSDRASYPCYTASTATHDPRSSNVYFIFNSTAIFNIIY